MQMQGMDVVVVFVWSEVEAGLAGQPEPVNGRRGPRCSCTAAPVPPYCLQVQQMDARRGDDWSTVKGARGRRGRGPDQTTRAKPSKATPIATSRANESSSSSSSRPSWGSIGCAAACMQVWWCVRAIRRSFRPPQRPGKAKPDRDTYGRGPSESTHTPRTYRALHYYWV